MFRHPRAPQTSGVRSLDSVGRCIVLVVSFDVVLISFSGYATLRGGEHSTKEFWRRRNAFAQGLCIPNCRTPSCSVLLLERRASGHPPRCTGRPPPPVRTLSCIVIPSYRSASGSYCSSIFWSSSSYVWPPRFERRRRSRVPREHGTRVSDAAVLISCTGQHVTRREICFARTYLFYKPKTDLL